ncbi:MAG: 50S ribosomal protein L29 [Candidatus Zixiibacteriota bacterium]|jgi:large subunit ribosomal protein L29
MKSKLAPLRDLTRPELLQKRNELEEEYFNLRMRQSMKTLENPLRMRHIGREMARIMTILVEDEKGIRKLAENKTTILGGAAEKRKE